MAEIITYPNPLLREKSQPIQNIQEALSLAQKLQQTILDKEGRLVGVGLSAIQIGIPKRIFLAFSKSSRKFLVFVNPQIIWYSKALTSGIPETKNKYEGCLSLPNKWAIIRRAKKIKITYQTLSGQTLTRQFSGQIATIIQHEYDHLEGILFIDRAKEQGEKIYELAKDEKGKEYLKEINYRAASLPYQQTG